MSLPDVAVVVPSRNRRDLLASTLDSLVAQVPPPAQIIVVSDGSTDGTDALVQERALVSPNVTLVTTTGIGPGGARNAGWRRSTGELIAFIDDDCVASPGWLEALTAPFADPAVGVVQGQTLPARAMGANDRSIVVTSEYGLYESCNISYRRNALEEVGGFDETFGVRPPRAFGLLPGRPHFGEDTLLAWRVKRCGWRSAFSAAAVVRHAVFPRSYRQSLRQEWGKSMFPYLLREVPEIRDLLPAGRYFLRRQSPLAQSALAGLVLLCTGKRRLGVALAAPYLAWVVRQCDAVEASQQAGRDLVASAGLLVGSVRYRRLLL